MIVRILHSTHTQHKLKSSWNPSIQAARENRHTQACKWVNINNNERTQSNRKKKCKMNSKNASQPVVHCMQQNKTKHTHTHKADQYKKKVKLVIDAFPLLPNIVAWTPPIHPPRHHPYRYLHLDLAVANCFHCLCHLCWCYSHRVYAHLNDCSCYCYCCCLCLYCRLCYCLRWDAFSVAWPAAL